MNIYTYDTYTCINNIIFLNKFLYNNITYRSFLYHFVRGMFEKLTHRMARWHIYWHVGM